MPALDAHQLAQPLDIADQMAGGVVDGLAQRQRAAGAALIEDDDAIMGRIEEAAMGRPGPGTRPAMKEDHRHALGIAALLPIHLVPAVEIEHAAVERLDLRVKRAVVHGIPPGKRRAPL